MTYSLLESKIRTVPEEYLAVIDAFIDGLLIRNSIAEKAPEPKQKRTLGLLKGKASVKFADDFEISPEEMLGL